MLVVQYHLVCMLFVESHIAETQITEYLVEGQSAEFIATKRGVSVETVRTQIKAIMAKLGVSRQVELVVRLGEL